MKKYIVSFMAHVIAINDIKLLEWFLDKKQ